MAASALLALMAVPAQAQYDNRGAYTSQDTPQARAQRSGPEKLRDQRNQQRARQGAQATKQTAESEGEGGLSGPIPELQVFAAVDLAEIYTSNATGTVAGGNKHDFYTRPRLSLAVRQESARLVASADYSLSGEWYARNHRLDQLTHDLNAYANAELLRETLFLDARAFAKPTMLTRAGSLVAGGVSPSRNNYRDTYGYALRPTLMHQFGNWVEASVWASQSGTFFVTPSTTTTVPLPGFFNPPSNTNSTGLGARIASLSDFARLQWSVTATAQDSYQSGGNTHRQRAALANLSYAATQSIRLIFTGGYQTYHSSYFVGKDLDGPTLLGGLQFTSGPDFLLYVMAGTQNNFPTYIGSLQWQMTPLTSLAVDATDKVQTPQERLMGNLQNGGIPGGMTGENPILTPDIPSTGGPVPIDGLSIDNSVSRYRQINATLLHRTARMRYALTAFGTIQDRLDAVPIPGLEMRSDSFGLRASVGRDLTRALFGAISFAASKANEYNGHDVVLEGDVSLRYRASETLSFYTQTSVLHRVSRGLVGGFENGNLIDTRVTVGVTKAF